MIKKISQMQFLDHYEIRARLQPALLTLFPVFYTVAVTYPELYTIVNSLIALVTACGVLVLFSHLCRSGGLKLEKRLFAINDQLLMPSVRWMRHDDHHLEAPTKKRYCSFFQTSIPSLNWPSAEDEARASDAANEVYRSANRWLIQKTRDRARFELLYKELVNYGFRRNLRGAKAVGIILSLLSFGVYVFYFFEIVIVQNTGMSVGQTSTAILSFAAVFLWVFYVTDEFVISSARVMPESGV